MSIPKINAYQPISFTAHQAKKTESAKRQSPQEQQNAVKTVALAGMGLIALGAIVYAIVHNKPNKLAELAEQPAEAAKEALKALPAGKNNDVVITTLNNKPARELNGKLYQIKKGVDPQSAKGKYYLQRQAERINASEAQKAAEAAAKKEGVQDLVNTLQAIADKKANM